jgi:hypothetical protein
MTALSNLDLVLIQQDSYSFVPKGEIIDAAEDRATIVRYPDLIVITIRGTANRTGWWSDFQIAPKVAKVHPQLGVCEAGFLAGAESLWPLIKARIETTPQVPIIVQGHSRGAAIVPIMVGLMILDGIVPTYCIAWEKPWSGGKVLRQLIDQHNIVGIEPWHGDDPVPLVPAEAWLVMNFWPIKHFGKWTTNPFDSHGIAGIVTDVKAIYASGGTF